MDIVSIRILSCYATELRHVDVCVCDHDTIVPTLSFFFQDGRPWLVVKRLGNGLCAIWPPHLELHVWADALFQST